uniref:Uncharacterized protein n=1 Tax=Anguilla anguilla TaxID=7936 RepID=A0A0E9UYE0_ANGAN
MALAQMSLHSVRSRGRLISWKGDGMKGAICLRS